MGRGNHFLLQDVPAGLHHFWECGSATDAVFPLSPRVGICNSTRIPVIVRLLSVKDTVVESLTSTNNAGRQDIQFGVKLSDGGIH